MRCGKKVALAIRKSASAALNYSFGKLRFFKSITMFFLCIAAFVFKPNLMFLGSKYNSVKACISNLSLAIMSGKLLNNKAKYCLINVPKSDRGPLLNNNISLVAFFFFRKSTFHAMQRLPILPIVDIGSVFCVTILALCTSNESFFHIRPRTSDNWSI